MQDVSNIGVDPAGQVFQIAGATAEGEVGFRRKLSHKRFLAFVQIHPARRVAREACATARHRARTSKAPGHDLRLLAPKFVKPYVKNQKYDMADAEAIAEAGSRPTMRFVEVMTPGQQGLGVIFRLRVLLVGQRTQTVNASCRKHAGGVTWPPRRVWCRRGHGAGERIEMRKLPIFLPLFAAWRCVSSTGSMVCPGVSRPSLRKLPRSANAHASRRACRRCPELAPSPGWLRRLSRRRWIVSGSTATSPPGWASCPGSI